VYSIFLISKDTTKPVANLIALQPSLKKKSNQARKAGSYSQTGTDIKHVEVEPPQAANELCASSDTVIDSKQLHKVS
jgi:hypothetical protein